MSTISATNVSTSRTRMITSTVTPQEEGYDTFAAGHVVMRNRIQTGNGETVHFNWPLVITKLTSKVATLRPTIWMDLGGAPRNWVTHPRIPDYQVHVNHLKHRRGGLLRERHRAFSYLIRSEHTILDDPNLMELTPGDKVSIRLLASTEFLYPHILSLIHI